MKHEGWSRHRLIWGRAGRHSDRSPRAVRAGAPGEQPRWAWFPLRIFHGCANAHIFDCLRAAPLLPETGTVCDLGSGAGLPGVVLAIARPDLRFVLIEVRRNRAAFLDEATADLENAVVHGRRLGDLSRTGRGVHGEGVRPSAEVVGSRRTPPRPVGASDLLGRRHLRYSQRRTDRRVGKPFPVCACTVGSTGYHGSAVTKASAGAGAAPAPLLARPPWAIHPSNAKRSKREKKKQIPVPPRHPRHRPRDRDREPEGRGRQEHDGRQPRRLPR